jgi:hypothetical protein
MASERLREPLAILRGYQWKKDPLLLHQLYHDLESVFWVALVFVVQRCDADGKTEDRIHRLVTGDMETVDDAKGFFTHPNRGIRARAFELKGPCEFLIPFFRDFVGLCDSPEQLLIVENVLELINDAIARSPHEKFVKSGKISQSLNPSVGEKRSIDSGTNIVETESECSARAKTGEAHL